MSKKPVCIYGAGGHATVVAETLRAEQRQVAMYFDDNPSVVENSNGRYLPGLKLAGEANFKIPEFPLVLAIGNSRLRAELAAELNAQYTTAIHPDTIIAPGINIGEGSVVFANAVLQPNVRVGSHSIINTSASVDHDCQIGDFAHISPNATLCGEVHVGEGTHVGAGATIIEGVRLGRWSVIGAGAVVIRDVPDFTTVVGCPAHSITETKTNVSGSLNGELEAVRSIVNGIRRVAGRAELQQLFPDQKLQQDLELDSLELAEMTVLIESKFSVDVFEQGIVTTVQDVINQIQNR